MVDYNHKNAFLEFGSTSIKFYLVSATGESAGEVKHEIKAPWDLGYDVFESGRISPRSISHCLSHLKRLQEDYPEIPFEAVTAIGTAALREAQNVEIFQRLLWEELRLNIQIIEGGIEAFLLETGFKEMVETYPTGLFDLGGGSLELIEYLSAASTRKTSVPVGVIRLHCELRRTRDLYQYIRQGKKVVERTVKEFIIGEPPTYPELLGTGGTVRAVVKCTGKDSFTFEDIRELVDREVHGPVWPNMSPHRRKLFLPGLLALESLFACLGAQRVLYRTASVNRGLISLSTKLTARGT